MVRVDLSLQEHDSSGVTLNRRYTWSLSSPLPLARIRRADHSSD